MSLAMEPAVTVPQMERIMRSVAVSTTEADAALDAAAIAERFTGPALAAREANYKIRTTLPEHPAPTAIPAALLTLTSAAGRGLARERTHGADHRQEQRRPDRGADGARDGRPRRARTTRSPMRCRSRPTPTCPRLRLRRSRALALPEFKGLVMPPGQVAAAYADVLLKGDASEFATMFDPEGDVLREQLGVTGQQAINDTLPPTADIAFSNVVGSSPTVALATNDSGALVTASIEQTGRSPRTTAAPSDSSPAHPARHSRASPRRARRACSASSACSCCSTCRAWARTSRSVSSAGPRA